RPGRGRLRRRLPAPDGQPGQPGRLRPARRRDPELLPDGEPHRRRRAERDPRAAARARRRLGRGAGSAWDRRRAARGGAGEVSLPPPVDRRSLPRRRLGRTLSGPRSRSMRIAETELIPVVVPTRPGTVNSAEWGQDGWGDMEHILIRVRTDEG